MHPHLGSKESHGGAHCHRFLGGRNGQRRVHVLDESATSLLRWQSQGKAALYHLFEDPWSSLRAGGSSDPIEEIEWRACLMGLQAEAKALGLDARALEKEEDHDAISRRN